MSIPVPPLETADLPERKLPFWKLTGPGAVLVGLSIGAGEIIIWPRITAEFGASMLWAAALGVFIQLWVNIEVGRWAIATGESPYTGFSRMWKGFAHTFIILNVAGWLLPGWARTSGLALKALIPGVGPQHASPDWFWTAITFLGVGLVLFGPKRIYVAVERSIIFLILLITVGLIYIAFKVGTMEHVAEMGRGLINVGFKDEGLTAKQLFIALVFAGAGGTSNLFYAYYLRDKRIGMGARVPILLNPFRQREEAKVRSGYIFPENEENTRRFRDWLKFVKLDQSIYFWALNTFTMFLFIFGALAVLHPRGIVPAEGTLIWDEALILADSLGKPGQVIFLIIGVATLFSTQVALTDGVSRSLSDLFTTSFKFARGASQSTWYMRIAIFIILFGTVLTAIMERFDVSELEFLFNAAYMGGFAMAIYTPLLLWMNLRHLPKSARPGPINIVMVSFAAAVYIGFALFSIWTEITTRLLGWGG